jgi:hypothetical protein
MSRLVVPLKHRTLYATGDVLVSARLELLLKTDRGAWKAAEFLVDTGSELTTFSAYEAQQMGLPMPQAAAPGVRHHPTGLEIRSGYLRARVAGMDATEYAIPCLFLGDPLTDPFTISVRAAPRSLLALSGVVDKLRLTFDGDPSLPAPYGNLIVEKR